MGGRQDIPFVDDRASAGVQDLTVEGLAQQGHVGKLANLGLRTPHHVLNVISGSATAIPWAPKSRILKETCLKSTFFCNHII